MGVSLRDPPKLVVVLWAFPFKTLPKAGTLEKRHQMRCIFGKFELPCREWSKCSRPPHQPIALPRAPAPEIAADLRKLEAKGTSLVCVCVL